MWQSGDPVLDKYLPNRLDKAQMKKSFDPERDLLGMGGIFNPFNLALYTYSHQNPVRFFDPDGNFTSPTGALTIRNDDVGKGHYGASRSQMPDKKHSGVDLAAPAGSPVKAPITGSVEYKKVKGEKAILITGKEEGEKLSVRAAHVDFDDKLLGKIKPVKEGQDVPGVTVQDLTSHPDFKGADPHVHLEVYKAGQGEGGKDKRTNPMPYLRNEHKPSVSEPDK